MLNKLQPARVVIALSVIAGLLATAGCGGGDGEVAKGNSPSPPSPGNNTKVGSPSPAPPDNVAEITLPDLNVVAMSGAPMAMESVRLGEYRFVDYQADDWVGMLKEHAAKASKPGPTSNTIRLVAPPHVHFGHVKPVLISLTRVPVGSATLVAKVNPQEQAKLAQEYGGIPLTEAQVRWTPMVGKGPLPPKAPIKVMIATRGEWGIYLDVDKSPTAPSTITQLHDMLETMREPNGAFSKDTMIVIEAEDQVAWMYVVQAMEAATRAGFSNVQLSQTSGSPSEPLQLKAK